MIGKIHLKGLRYEIHIGVAKEERQQQQLVLIDVVLYLDIAEAVAMEDIRETVDYGAVQKAIKKFVEKKEYILLEKLTRDIVELLLSDFKKIQAVRCTCWKPNALKDAENVGVTLAKKRK